MGGKIVDLSIRALSAELSGVIKVVREVARNAGIAVPEKAVTALAFVFYCIILHTRWTALAAL